jgi:hypothetical protein
MSRVPPYMRDFCLRIVKKSIEEREYNDVVRRDLMQNLIQLRNVSESDKVDADEWKINDSGEIQLSGRHLPG